ncbi:pectinesterase inhibitor 28-like [Oryza glaberrima]|uniref:pectinesterase inhibitor 28-like n=1 Tax=Oryza glaberrima TaxID=4538 RepID=UPI00224C32D7|nr:pectinesterase inhibitor 28-like [Oryza glaberrima]
MRTCEMSVMADHQTLSAVFFLLLVPHAACMAMAKPSSSTLLQDNCELYAAGDRPSYDYCIRTLRADRASATADERGLAAIAARIARATAVATGAKIARLQRGETAPARRDGLAACAAEYAAAVRRLGRAARDVVSRSRGGAGAREMREAQMLLAEVTGAPERCDVAFEAAGGQGSPLDAADRDRARRRGRVGLRHPAADEADVM